MQSYLGKRILNPSKAHIIPLVENRSDSAKSKRKRNISSVLVSTDCTKSKR